MTPYFGVGPMSQVFYRARGRDVAVFSPISEGQREGMLPSVMEGVYTSLEKSKSVKARSAGYGAFSDCADRGSTIGERKAGVPTLAQRLQRRKQAMQTISNMARRKVNSLEWSSRLDKEEANSSKKNNELKLFRSPTVFAFCLETCFSCATP